MTYQPGIPTGTVNLDVDYLNIQNNFQQLDTQFGIDHIPFSNTGGTPPTGINGYHQYVHFNPFSTTATNPPNNYVPATATPSAVPSATPGFGQIFSCQVNDGINTDESLYWLSGGNRLITLTRNFTPASALTNGNGYTFLPGGFILMWGSVSVTPATNVSGNVIFPLVQGPSKRFPNAVFMLQATLSYTGDDDVSKGAEISVKMVNTSQFRYSIINGSATINGFFWMALGN